MQQMAANEGESRALEGAAETEQRVFIYRMLAQVLGGRPDERVVRALRAPGVDSTFAEFGYDLALGDLPQDTTEASELLKAEYTWLFIGPMNHLPPYQSVQEPGGHGELWGPSTQKMKRRLAAWGLEPTQTGKVPDHIEVQLDFMVQLAVTELELRKRGDDIKAATCRQAQRVLLDEHLLAWVPRFAEKVAARARVPLYREIARFTVDFLRQDREGLGEEQQGESET
jgi:TorA maturation chaperone TorD